MTYANLYFHLGLHKTATSYLQRSVFPRWPEIHYMRARNLEYFLRLPDTQKTLISCEGFSGATFASLADRVRGIVRLAEMFPAANTLIGFRPHGGFMSSLYSQYLRYGGAQRFEEFFPLDGSQGQAIWKRQDLNFQTIIETTESAFGKQPFVFAMEELKTNPKGLMADLADFFGTPAPREIEHGAVNAGLGSWQGELLRRVNQFAGITYSKDGRNRPFPRLRQWRLDPTNLCLEVLGRLPSRPLVSQDLRDRIDRDYVDDWGFVKSYIENSPYRRAGIGRR